MLRDTAVFGIKSNKVRRDAMAICNNLTYQQVYDFAKTEESTEARMVAIASHEAITDVHAVKSLVPRRKKQAAKTSQKQPEGLKQPRNQPEKSHKPCYRCGEDHGRRNRCPDKEENCNYCKQKGHYAAVCIRSNVKSMT